MANLSRFGGSPKSSLYLLEQAADQADAAGYGQFWVKNDTPNVPHFTDDVGTDFRLNASIVGRTFTPTIQDASLSDSESQSYTEQVGIYRKTDSLVHIWIDITVNSLGTLTAGNQVYIAGLPYAASNEYGVNVHYGSSLALTARDFITGVIWTSDSYIRLYNWNAVGGPAWMLLSELSAGGRLILSGTYNTTS